MKRWLVVILFLAGCSSRYEYQNMPSINNNKANPYVINGKVYYPKKSVPIGWVQRGIASWYGPNFHGRLTSNGEIYDMYALTAAHKTLPMNTIVKVTNLNNGKSVIVRINDRGPFVKGRIIDLSYTAGTKIGLNKSGTAPVLLKVIGFKGDVLLGGYMLQVGAFMKEDRAQKKALKLKRLGYNTKVLKSGLFYKVFIVGFNSYKEAKRFKLKHKLNGFIVGE